MCAHVDPSRVVHRILQLAAFAADLLLSADRVQREEARAYLEDRLAPRDPGGQAVIAYRPLRTGQGREDAIPCCS